MRAARQLGATFDTASLWPPSERQGHDAVGSGELPKECQLHLALDRSFPSRGLRMLFFRSAGVTLEFVAPIDAAGPGGRDAIDGIAWQVQDLDACRARLEAAGLDVSAARDGFKPGTRVATLRSGTGGLPTLLIQPTPQASAGVATDGSAAGRER